MTVTRWVRFESGGEIQFGTLDGDTIALHEGDLFAAPQATGATVALGEVTLLTPATPSKMVALANNFHDLIEKLGQTVPEEPLYFLKANTSFHPHGQPIRRPAAYDGKIIFEGELGIVIGKECRDVSVDNAYDYIFGCTCINDVTAIELLNKNPAFAQWTRCKAADTFGVFGPCIATGLDPARLVVKAVLNDSERQNYPISNMVFSPAELISKISHDMTLLPGDVIACGTNVGVGSMKPGSTIEITIDGVGTLSNTFE